jgi:hypothetical protein
MQGIAVKLELEDKTQRGTPTLYCEGDFAEEEWL